MLLQQLLEKAGITDYDKLTAEEKKTYQEWARVLALKEVTIDDVKDFVAKEKARAIEELLTLDAPREKQLFNKVLYRMTTALDAFISSPSAQREHLKKHLKQVFHIDI